MAKTLQERFQEALMAKGERQVLGRSTKYKTFTRATGGYYFLGSAGSLRFGASKSVSIPCSNKFKAALLGHEGGV